MKYKLLLFSFFLFSKTIGFSQENSFPESALNDTFTDIDGNSVSFESILEKNKGSVIFLDIGAQKDGNRICSRLST